MGLYRCYTTWPTIDPEDTVGLEDICDAANFSSSSSHATAPELPRTLTSSLGPFQNVTVFRLMRWWYSGSTKSASDLNRLVNDVLLQNDFDQRHLEGFNCSRETKRLDKYKTDENTMFPSSRGWKESSVKIHLPAERVTHSSESKAPEFEVPGVFHRSLIEIIKDTFQDAAALTYHYAPFKHFWKPFEDKPAERLYSELYSSDAMLEEYEKLYSKPSEPGCKLERMVASIMLWSDSTHLTSFGKASLWPIYLFFGNQSKYLRAKPQSFACHHLAYIPSVCHIMLI